MSRRAKRPLNQEACQAADDEIYARHAGDPRPNPLYDINGNKRPLSATDPAQTALRTEWMDLYIANGGEIEEPEPDPTPPGPIIVPCPDGPTPTPDPTPPPPPVTPPPTPDPGQTPSTTANLHVQLQHACDQSPLDGGTVRITGAESRELPTGADGWANFEGITPGDYNINGIHPQHHEGITTATAPDETTTVVQLPLQATITIVSAKADYTVVLDATGNPPAAYPILEFTISNGPPNHFFDIQLSRDGAGAFTGGPGLAGSWGLQADGRDARMGKHVFSSWANGQRALQLDGSGAGTFKMPLEWWRDQARQKLSTFTTFTYHFRVLAFPSGGTPVCCFSAAGSVTVKNNLTAFRVVDNGYIDNGGAKSIRMEFTVREADTLDMYTFVQWMQGTGQYWRGTPPVMEHPNHLLYDILHVYDFPVFTIDRLHTNPRYWDGVYTPSADKKTASATDAPSIGLDAGYSHSWVSIDFETRVHLNFEVPAAVTVTRKDGSAPVFGIVAGNLANPQPITLDTSSWNTRALFVRAADGTVPAATHPNTYAGP